MFWRDYIFKVKYIPYAMIDIIVAVLFVCFGLYCLFKPDNFLLPYIKNGEAGVRVLKKYGKEKAIKFMKIFGAGFIIVGLGYIIYQLVLS